MVKRIVLVILILASALFAQTPQPNKPGCLLIHNDGGHRLMGYFVAGLPGALLTGGKNRYVDSVNVPPEKIKMTYSEKELQAMQRSGSIRVIVSQKGTEDYGSAWSSCLNEVRPPAPVKAAPTLTPAPVQAWAPSTAYESQTPACQNPITDKSGHKVCLDSKYEY